MFLPRVNYTAMILIWKGEALDPNTNKQDRRYFLDLVIQSLAMYVVQHFAYRFDFIVNSHQQTYRTSGTPRSATSSYIPTISHREFDVHRKS